MNSDDLVLLNGQLCSKDMALMVIDKVLPTVLDVVADKLKNGRSSNEVEEAAKTVVKAAVGAILLKSQVAPRS